MMDLGIKIKSKDLVYFYKAYKTRVILDFGKMDKYTRMIKNKKKIKKII